MVRTRGGHPGGLTHHRGGARTRTTKSRAASRQNGKRAGVSRRGIKYPRSA